MNLRIHVFLAIVLICCYANGQHAAAIIADCIEAHGGKERIQSLQFIKTDFIQHTNMIEQSERPEGPYIADYQTGSEVRDIAHQRLHRESKSFSFLRPSLEAPATEQRFADGILAYGRGGRWFPVNALAADTDEYLSYSPEQILLQLIENQQLKLQCKEKIQGVENWKIYCPDSDLTVFINCFTHLITAVEYTKAYSPSDYFFFSFWGDYATRLYFSIYSYIPPGVYYPVQIDIVKNDWNYRKITYVNMEVNPPVEDSIFQISSETRQMAQDFAGRSTQMLTLNPENSVQVADDITSFKGAWNVTLIEQSDGIVIIEAPIGSDYSAQVIAHARKTYPNKPIKAVISTSDAWPHLSGLRQYVAEEIPVYALGLNQPIIEKLLTANFATYPDQLAKQPKRPKINWMESKTELGDLEIYPIRGEGGERMLMVYFPKEKTLYAADLIQQNRDGSFFMPGYLMEVKRAIEREGLEVARVFAMHSDPLDWAAIAAALATIEKK